MNVHIGLSQTNMSISHNWEGSRWNLRRCVCKWQPHESIFDGVLVDGWMSEMGQPWGILPVSKGVLGRRASGTRLCYSTLISSPSHLYVICDWQIYNWPKVNCPWVVSSFWFDHTCGRHLASHFGWGGLWVFDSDICRSDSECFKRHVLRQFAQFFSSWIFP